MAEVTQFIARILHIDVFNDVYGMNGLLPLISSNIITLEVLERSAANVPQQHCATGITLLYRYTQAFQKCTNSLGIVL